MGITVRDSSISNHEYFVTLARRLTTLMGGQGPEGQAFRVDLRLRPEGTQGQLALSLLSYEAYYARLGQTWERMALLKARPVAGDCRLGEEFLALIQPFVYQSHLDAEGVRQLRDMKGQIDAQLADKAQSRTNVKLGLGGIREIEFLIQLPQLLYGGRQPTLQERHSLRALTKLREAGLMTSQVETTLRVNVLLSASPRTLPPDGTRGADPHAAAPCGPAAAVGTAILAIPPGRPFIRTTWSVRRPCTPFLLRRFRMALRCKSATFTLYKRGEHPCSKVVPQHLCPTDRCYARKWPSGVQTVPPQVLDELFAQLDDDYFRVFTAAQIATHVLLLAAVDEQQPVQIRVCRARASSAEILVAAYDCFGEFSIITGLMAAYGLNIRDGQVFSYHRGPGRADTLGQHTGWAHCGRVYRRVCCRAPV